MTGTWEAPDGVALFDTAEEAALSGWARTPSANASAVEVRPGYDPGTVYVVLQLDADPGGYQDQDVVTCCQTPTGQWWWSGSTGDSSAR